MGAMNRSSAFRRIFRSRFAGDSATPSSDFRATVSAMCIRLEAACKRCRLLHAFTYELLPRENADTRAKVVLPASPESASDAAPDEQEA